MNWQRLATSLTVLNVVLFMFILHRVRLSVPQGVAPVLRGRALEIIDEQGRVRASLSVLPENPNVKWNGKPYPEIVLLKLMSPEGSPVKLGATKSGASLVLGGESKSYVQVLAEDGETTLKLINKDGLERLIKP
jgi:hypothetical protein